MIEHSSTLNQNDNILIFFFREKARIHAYFVIFFKATVHKWARRDINNCLNDINRSALEKKDLGASFELYGGCPSCLSTFLRVFKVYPW